MVLLEKINQFIWGIPALLMILSLGIYLTIRTGLIQFRFFPKAFQAFITAFKKRKSDKDDISPFRALCTALAATVGTGNLAGVAGAIAIGGPGSIFWMWICALLGMVIKFSEAVLSVRFRIRDASGGYIGGPMYMIQYGMGKRWTWLACIYAFLGTIAAFGVGNGTQINTVIASVNSIVTAFGGTPTQLRNLGLGLIFAFIIGLALMGGVKRIGAVTESLIPFASLAYVLLGLGVLVIRFRAVPSAFQSILTGAFQPHAVTGGMIGSMMQAVHIGVSRGVFTNEAGMGTAGIAHSTAKVSHPVEQGLMGIVEVFLDTIVICTITALVILCSGISITYGQDNGMALTAAAFTSIYGKWINIFLSAAIACFAIATILGWGLYGIRCVQFLFGSNAWRPFVWIQIIITVISAVLNTKTVWLLTEMVNGLMAIPNLFAVGVLSPELMRQIKDYRTKQTEGKLKTNTA